jgi:hypothetical protein
VTVAGPATIDVAGKAQFAATVLDASGTPMTGIALTWSTDAVGVATVDPSGMVTGTGAGTTTVHATAGTIVGSAPLQVLPALRFCRPDNQLDPWCRLTDGVTDQTFPPSRGIESSGPTVTQAWATR